MVAPTFTTTKTGAKNERINEAKRSGDVGISSRERGVSARHDDAGRSNHGARAGRRCAAARRHRRAGGRAAAGRPAAPPTAAAPPPAAPPSAVEAAPKPPTATEAMPATRPDVLPPIDVGAWFRVGGVFQNGTDPKQDQRLAHGQHLRRAPRRRQDPQERQRHAEPDSNMANFPDRRRSPTGSLRRDRGRHHLVRLRWTSSTCGPATCWSPSTARTPRVRSSCFPGTTRAS